MSIKMIKFRNSRMQVCSSSCLTLSKWQEYKKCEEMRKKRDDSVWNLLTNHLDFRWLEIY